MILLFRAGTWNEATTVPTKGGIHVLFRTRNVKRLFSANSSRCRNSRTCSILGTGSDGTGRVGTASWLFHGNCSKAGTVPDHRSRDLVQHFGLVPCWNHVHGTKSVMVPFGTVPNGTWNERDFVVSCIFPPPFPTIRPSHLLDTCTWDYTGFTYRITCHYKCKVFQEMTLSIGLHIAVPYRVYGIDCMIERAPLFTLRNPRVLLLSHVMIATLSFSSLALHAPRQPALPTNPSPGP